VDGRTSTAGACSPANSAWGGRCAHYRGRVCRDVSPLRPGQTASFTVHAIAAARAAGRTLTLLATAAAPGAALAVGSDRIAVIAQSFAGTGRG
jgi:hypothetical protein